MKVFLYILFTFSTLLGYAQNKQLSDRSEESVISKKLDEDERNVDADPKDKEQLLLQLKSRSEELNYTLGILRSGSNLMKLYAYQAKYREVIKLADKLKNVLQIAKIRKE